MQQPLAVSLDDDPSHTLGEFADSVYGLMHSIAFELPTSVDEFIAAGDDATASASST